MSLSATRRCGAALQIALLIVGSLFVLTRPAEAACCAGLVAMHGESCCEQAAFDAAAERCCSPDDSPVAAETSPELGAKISLSVQSVELVGIDRKPPAPDRRSTIFDGSTDAAAPIPLYTLQAALLI